ncbi:hypothetical protein [Caldisalinibacter kiritimatiensis]|uniref:Holin n=1 Tax=Caldisalinibacter kiritimatiensis TaxID=1304284 RepID=R1CVP2_9FIRM|nr:hypothetical protein [Caldisalinibacter kiritimatiensis]EOD00709.1 hypothetical protein L21TH_1235 [Caldisalinibacter kiritimatiensis]
MQFQVYDIYVVPLIIFLTKVIISIGIPKKFSPLISVVLGIVVGIFYFSPDDILKGILLGVFLAASSVGFYSGSKNVYQEMSNRMKHHKESTRDKEDK